MVKDLLIVSILLVMGLPAVYAQEDPDVEKIRYYVEPGVKVGQVLDQQAVLAVVHAGGQRMKGLSLGISLGALVRSTESDPFERLDRLFWIMPRVEYNSSAFNNPGFFIDIGAGWALAEYFYSSTVNQPTGFTPGEPVSSASNDASNAVPLSNMYRLGAGVSNPMGPHHHLRIGASLMKVDLGDINKSIISLNVGIRFLQ